MRLNFKNIIRKIRGSHKCQDKDNTCKDNTCVNLQKRLEHLSNTYYRNQQLKWEQEHKKDLDGFISVMENAASHGKYHLDVKVSYNDDDWYRFNKYWDKQHIIIKDVEVNDSTVDIKSYKFRFSWWS